MGCETRVNGKWQWHLVGGSRQCATSWGGRRWMHGCNIITELSQSTQELLKNAAFLGSLDSRLLEGRSCDKFFCNQYYISIYFQPLENCRWEGSDHVHITVHGRIMWRMRIFNWSVKTFQIQYTEASPVKSQDRCRFHVARGNWTQLGSEFYPRGTKGQDNFFPVLRQFRLVMDDIKNQGERNAININAALCLGAGELAVSNGDCRTRAWSRQVLCRNID
jgi:hypothetical protein